MRDLHQELGHALSAWADLEDALCDCFKYVTAIQDRNISRAIFYSSRSFLGRSDMLLAALHARPECDHCFERRDLIKAITKKAVAYNTTRNILAHNSLMPVSTDAGHDWAWVSPTTLATDGGLRTEHIKTCRMNFEKLRDLALTVILRPKLAKERIQELLGQVHRLPKLAHSDVENPMPVVRKQRQKPSPPKS